MPRPQAYSSAEAGQLLRAQYRQALAPVTEQLLASAGIRAGQHVLDLGCGDGDTALLAAELVGPTGRVIALDASPEAVQGLVDRLVELPSFRLVTVRVAPAESFAAEAGSIDVVLARNSVMYFDDLPRVLENVHAALRPGGRIAASVYGPLENDPFHAIPVAAIRRRCTIRRPYRAYVQAFRVSADDVEHALRRAGFAQVERRAVAVSRSFPSVDEAIDALRQSSSLGELLALLPPQEVADAWVDIADGFRAHETASGLPLPGAQVVLLASK